MNLLELVENSIKKASDGESALPEEILSMPGMSSKKVRSLLNYVVAGNGIKYLEIGVWKGSTLRSALHGNKPDYAVAIDNFSEFNPEGDSKAIFLKNLENYMDKFIFFDCDSFKFDRNNFRGNLFNVYFYDGAHEEIDQENALKYYIDNMQNKFVYICDDWNFKKVKNGTYKAIKDLKLKVIRKWHLPSPNNGNLSLWWNGLYVAVLEK